EDVTGADQGAWGEWLASCAENRWAWDQAQQLQQRLHGLPTGVTGRAFSLADQPEHSGRRTLLKGLVLAVGGGMLSYGGYRQAHTAGWTADYRTATGEQLRIVLADGT